MTERFAFTLMETDGAARLGEIATPRGVIRTPAFMPVGTAATVKARLSPTSSQAPAPTSCSANTYHLMLRPGAERVARLGGLHRFMRWDRPILTDSGGFQVMSLAKLRKITDEGVAFQSHIDGSRARAHAGARRSRSSACSAPTSRCSSTSASRCRPTREEVERAMRAVAGAGRSAAQRAFAAEVERARKPGQALFGIVQGGIDPALRPRSADALVAMDLPATRSAAWRSASRRRRCSRRWS